jgi:type IV pilus assembly protein PilN
MDNNGYMFFNLLPYREQIKKEQIKQFSLLMGFFAIIAGVLIFIIYSAIAFGIESQESRNKYITEQNQKLDRNIKEISTLKDEIKDTLAKRKVVENLQINRSDSVNILNTIALQLPDGMTLKSIKEVDDKLTIIGTTISNNKVSNYMTNLAASNIFINPELIEVKATQIVTKKQNARVKDDQNISEFTIVVYLKPKVTEDEAKGKGKFKNKKIVPSQVNES